MPHVLVVEDDPDIRGLVVMTLERESLEVQTEMSVAGAWVRLHERSYDLAIVDWNLPGAPGIELVRSCRADGDFADLPIIMLTARAREMEIEAGLEAGADAYITKPFSPRDLAEAAHKFLGE